jgi:pyruvate dehydrogenase E2 component (dihydrolipoamide acetyltransferase)
MATLLRMPEVAANATHAILAAWTVNENQKVNVGDSLADIETDKAMVELAAEKSGTLARQLVKAGERVEVGAPIGVLLNVGETRIDIEALISGTPRLNATTLAPAEATRQSTFPAEVPAAAERGARVFASPLARRLAANRGLDLATVTGTGPNGRVIQRDVEAASATPVPMSASPLSGMSAPVAVASEVSYVEVPHSSMRKTIARRLTESKATVPHFYLKVDCRMDRLMALRTEVNAGALRKISVNDFVVRAAAVALKEVPGANVAWTENAMRRFAQADISVAVSTASGLITPIVRAADSKTLSVISAEIAELAARARSGQLRPNEYQGGTFSISNLGMQGVTEFSAIINPPQAAILAVGAIRTMPVVEDGKLSAAQVMCCTLSVDHRAIDGALAATWLAAFRRLIENPMAMLV